MMDAIDWLLNVLFWALLVLPSWLMIFSPVILLLVFLFWAIRTVVRARRSRVRIKEE